MSEPNTWIHLLGRDKTLETVRKAMDCADQSKGTFVVLNGEAGIGKTAVVRKMEEEARARGWAVLSSECIVGKGGDPYLPIITAIRNFLEERSRDRKSKAMPSLPMGLMGAASRDELAEQWRTVKELKNERDRMFENVLDLIRDALKTSPVLFSIDDLHWAEMSALQLLYYIVRSTAHDRVLVMGTYRTEELENPRVRHPLLEILSRVRQEDMLTTIELPRLSENDTGRLVNALASAKLPQALVKRIYQETGGNPFFIKEFMRDLQLKDKVDASSIAIPSSISLLIKNRLKSLDKEQQEVLQTCAVLGQQFSYDLLTGVAGVDEADLVNALDGLIGFRVLEEKAHGQSITYAFTHSLMQEVVYDGLSAARKRLLHAKAGEQLEKIFRGRLEQAVYQLAYHFSRTSLQSKAFKYTAMAGLVSCNQMAMDEAKQNLETALDMLQRLEPEEATEAKEVELLSAMGKVHMFLGNTHKALDCHTKALDLAPEASVEKAAALRNIAEVQIEVGKWKECIRTFKAAIAISEKLNDLLGLAEGYRGLTWLAVELGDHDDAMKYAEMGITQAKKAGNKYLQGKILIDLGMLCTIRYENTKALNLFEEALKVLDHNKHLDQLSRAYNNIGDVYTTIGKYDRAMDNFENCIEIAKVVGDHRWLALGQANIGVVLGKMGRHDEAMENFEIAAKEFERTGDKYGLVVVQMSKGLVERDVKNFKAGEEHYLKAIKLCEECDFEIYLGIALSEYGVLLKRWGKKAEALEQLDRLLKLKKDILDKKTKVGKLEESLNELMELKK